ncbi:hypothetical protein HF313_26065 [Massilia atriviolacea]|uniref:Nucleotidyltransferase domain-containing protein n=1 Tax=Massilia atriviolacea TaxID=2495579 RepID=A0A430HMZ9_9BURK|nr:hypothetical protein [Massilia atriviolacea]RSZ58869.1 hypothetical protein EJB06_11030 [Massilia atriviolacea]
MLTGSLSAGSGDIYSDIDLEVVCANERARVRVKQAVSDCLRRHGRPIAFFPATHLNMPQLLIHFWDCDDALVKIDIHYTIADPAHGPGAGLSLVGPAAAPAAPAAAPAAARVEPAFLEDLYNKFCGWMWYTHTKIARGEYWEAEDSLGVMRSQALMPLLQLAQGLPLEGMRRVEQRFSQADQAALLATRCASHDPAELRRVLFALCACFEQAAQRLEPAYGQGWRSADLDKMKRFIVAGNGRL